MKRGITINFSNRTLYTLIAIFSLLVISAVAYAVGSGTVPNPGHAIEDLETCAAGQTLVSNASGTGCPIALFYRCPWKIVPAN